MGGIWFEVVWGWMVETDKQMPLLAKSHAPVATASEFLIVSSLLPFTMFLARQLAVLRSQVIRSFDIEGFSLSAHHRLLTLLRCV